MIISREERAAIHIDARAGQKAGFVRRQGHDQVGNFIGTTLAPQRRAGRDVFAHIFVGVSTKY